MYNSSIREVITLETFGQRLRKLRNEKGMYGEELGKILNVTKVAISKWENDLRFPDKDTLIKIAEYFNVSLDYLLGKSDTRQIENIEDSQKLTPKDKKDIAKQLEHMMDNLDKIEGLEFYNQPQDEEDKEFIRRGFQRFLEDVKIYNKVKYNPKKNKK